MKQEITPRIESIKDINRLIKSHKFKVFGVGGTPITRAESYSFIEDYELICSVPSQELSSVEKKLKVNCFEMKNDAGFAIKKPEKILSKPQVVEFIKESSNDKTVGILVMKPTQVISGLCRKNNWIMLGNDPKVVEKFNNKNEFQKLLKKVGIPTEAVSVRLLELGKSLDKIFKDLGDDIVVQLPESGGGRGTFFFNKKDRADLVANIIDRIDTLNENVPKNVSVVINRFFKGPSLSSLGCITRENGILSCDPQYQLIDINEVTKGKTDATGVFCGHDWVLSNKIPKSIKLQSQQITEKIGLELKKQGALGVFGVDFVWDKTSNSLVPNEINVRITGTFPTIVFTQQISGEVPLIAFHILDFFDIPYKIENTKVYNSKKDRSGAHIILFNPAKHDVVCNNEIKGGVYTLDNKGKAKFIREGFELVDIKRPEEFIVTDGVPRKGVVRRTNRKIVKIITKESICDTHHTLNKWGSKIISATYNALDLKAREILKVVVKKTKDCSKPELIAYNEKVKKFRGEDLFGLIKKSHYLAFAYNKDNILVGVGAIKGSNTKHRDNFFKKANLHEEMTRYELELGWLFVEKETRGFGVATVVTKKLLECIENKPVYAVTNINNTQTIKILERLGFKSKGNNFFSEDKKLKFNIYLKK